MGAHAVLSPSGAKRWATCAGSVALSAGIPDKSNLAADEGTAYHFLAAHCLQNNLDPLSFVGNVIVVWDHPESDSEGCDFLPVYEGMTLVDGNLVERNRFTVTKEDATYVANYITYIQSKWQGNGELFIEVALPLTPITNEPDAKGTADALIARDDGHLYVIDLKFGRGVAVDAEDNYQLQMYALAAVLGFANQNRNFSKVTLAVFQPRAGTGEPKEWETTVEDLLTFKGKMRRAADTVKLAKMIYDQSGGKPPEGWADTYLLVTEEGCKFCRAKAKCPMLAGVAMKASDVASDEGFSDMTNVQLVEKHPEGGMKVLKSWTLSQKMDAVPAIEAWLKSIRAEVESELLAGNPVPGYKLVRGKKGNREWDKAEEVEALLKKARLKVEEIYDFKLRTPPTIEKAISKERPKIWAKLEPHITQKEGSLSVAPESDPREAVDTKPSTDGFDEVDPNNDLLGGV